jgi:hypothetical protein
MDQGSDNNKDNKPGEGYTAYLFKRVVLAVFLIAAVLVGLSVGIDYFQKPQIAQQALPQPTPSTLALERIEERPTAAVPQNRATTARRPQNDGTQTQAEAPAAPPAAAQIPTEGRTDQPTSPAAAPASEDHVPVQPAPQAAPDTHAPPAAPQPSHASPAQPDTFRPIGVSFADAVIAPINHELNDRFWGWRPNDIINVTDNVNQFQLGVLEVTRRTVVQLTERISRTGYNDAFDRNLENAMNYLMIRAGSYWFPSPEAKYKESVDELVKYKNNLLAGKARFYIRTDNLIPLLAAYEDLLGSSDENLVKLKEADGSQVSFFSADDYFYYAKGVASAMATVLEAVERDFSTTLENRRGSNELLHHAISSCRRAAVLDPWIVFNGDLDGILANHRAHMAAPISHARFYLGQLIKTLST